MFMIMVAKYMPSPSDDYHANYVLSSSSKDSKSNANSFGLIEI